MILKEIDAQLANWLAECPQLVKDLAAKYHPNAVYRLKATAQKDVMSADQMCVLVAYCNDGTVSIRIFNPQLCVFIPGIFGIDPTHLEECDVNPVIKAYILANT